VSVRKRNRVTDSLQADMEAAAAEAGTDVDTLTNQVSLSTSATLFH